MYDVILHSGAANPYDVIIWVDAPVPEPPIPVVEVGPGAGNQWGSQGWGDQSAETAQQWQRELRLDEAKVAEDDEEIALIISLWLNLK